MLKKQLQKYRLILASGSPRRQQFFKDLDLDFEIRLKDIPEIYPPNLQRQEITNYLAALKASAFEGQLQDHDILITSDTIVWHNNQALGKPKDRQDAFAMLQSLSGATHEVISSVCFKTKNNTHILYDVSQVTFAVLSDSVINYYLDHYNPMDKAGSYGIQDWIGCVAVVNITGSYTNVMGLPMHKVFEYLNQLS